MTSCSTTSPVPPASVAMTGDARGHPFEHDVAEVLRRSNPVRTRPPAQYRGNLLVPHVPQEEHSFADSDRVAGSLSSPRSRPVARNHEARVRKFREQPDQGVYTLPRHEAADGDKVLPGQAGRTPADVVAASWRQRCGSLGSADGNSPTGGDRPRYDSGQ